MAVTDETAHRCMGMGARAEAAADAPIYDLKSKNKMPKFFVKVKNIRKLNKADTQLQNVTNSLEFS